MRFFLRQLVFWNHKIVRSSRSGVRSSGGDQPVGSENRQQGSVRQTVELLIDKVDQMTLRQEVLPAHRLDDQLREFLLAHHLLAQEPSLNVEDGCLPSFDSHS